MIKKHNISPVQPSRVVVIGANGFVGSEIVKALSGKKINIYPIGKNDIDLLSDYADDRLSEIIKPDDVIIFVSAKAPCKNLEMLSDNIKMVKVICNVLNKNKANHVIYISSDAVYKDSSSPLSENSCAEPETLHGVMHLAREVALKTYCSSPLAIVRPTLIYGLNDPHNGYGPNRFRRLASKNEEITLFGNGEELRDHIAVDDLAELVSQIVLYKAEGVINAVSGEVVSFCELAEFIVSKYQNNAGISSSLRVGKIPHNGYRAFNNSCLLKEFPEISFKSWRLGVLRLCESIAND